MTCRTEGPHALRQENASLAPSTGELPRLVTRGLGRTLKPSCRFLDGPPTLATMAMCNFLRAYALRTARAAW